MLIPFRCLLLSPRCRFCISFSVSRFLRDKLYPWDRLYEDYPSSLWVKNTADGFDWSEAPLIFTGFFSFPLARQERWLLRGLYPYGRGRIAFTFTLFITLCTATNFGYVFFCYLFSSTRELFFKQFLYYIFLRFSHQMHTWLATVAPIR